MTEYEEKRVVGRTWVDLWVSSGYIIVAILFISAVFIGVYYFYGELPRWIFIAIGMSLSFVPFLFERAKEDSQLFIVCDEPLKMTESRPSIMSRVLFIHFSAEVPSLFSAY